MNADKRRWRLLASQRSSLHPPLDLRWFTCVHLRLSAGPFLLRYACQYVNLRFKAVLPVAGALLAGVLLFVWITLRLEPTARQIVILVAAAGAIVIPTLMLTVLAILIQRPLTELQEKIARVRRGDLAAEVHFDTQSDEIGQLGHDFNDMLRQLRESRDEVNRLHQTQMSRAEHLATLGELAAGLAHEIRNPLAGIVGVMEVVSGDLPDDSPAQEVLREAKQETLRIKRILSDLLEYARPKPPNFQMSDLNHTAEHAASLARQQVASRPITIEFTPAAGDLMLLHDSAKLQQVVLNLVLNAIQAIGSRQGLIEVRLEDAAESAILQVRDNGRGIAAADLPNIFRPFFTTKGGGTGLGLSLTRSIVESHGGRIVAESAPGQGTIFILRLPKGSPASA
jgi:signal transduction histidine kinase